MFVYGAECEASEISHITTFALPHEAAQHAQHDKQITRPCAALNSSRVMPASAAVDGKYSSVCMCSHGQSDNLWSNASAITYT